MTTAGVQPKIRELRIRITQRLYPPYDDRHGTASSVVERTFAFDFPQGTAEVDQTDYGHPGRFNPCHPRLVPPALQPKTNQLVAAATALAGLLE